MTPLTSPLTVHAGASQTNYVSSNGNIARSADLPVLTTTPSWYLLERVEVAAPAETGAIATFGDSITDGARSTPNTNNRWPDHLAKRLLAGPGNTKLAVLNTGIGGNRLLRTASLISASTRWPGSIAMSWPSPRASCEEPSEQAMSQPAAVQRRDSLRNRCRPAPFPRCHARGPHGRDAGARAGSYSSLATCRTSK